MMFNTDNSLYSGPSTQPQVIVQPMQNKIYNDNQRVKFTPAYISTPAGIIRLLLIIFQFAGLISAACVTYIYAPTPVDYASVRDAYLGFSIVGFILSLVIFILYTLNVLTVGAARKVPWALIILILDIIWLIPMFILSIVCALKEGNYRAQLSTSQIFLNIGAFAAAAFFGFITSFLYGVDAGYSLVTVVRKISDK